MKGKTKKHVRQVPGMKNLRCQYCGATARLRSAEGIYRHGGYGVELYVCSNYPSCDSYVRVHPGTEVPVGSLADAKLRALRVRAHQHLGALYESGLMTKQEAYSWLAFALCLPPSQTHIGYFGEHYCNLVISECSKYMETWKHKAATRDVYLNGGGSDAARSRAAEAR